MADDNLRLLWLSAYIVLSFVLAFFALGIVVALFVR